MDGGGPVLELADADAFNDRPGEEGTLANTLTAAYGDSRGTSGGRSSVPVNVIASTLHDIGHHGKAMPRGDGADNLIVGTLTAADPNAPARDGKRQDGSRSDRIPITAASLRGGHAEGVNTPGRAGDADQNIVALPLGANMTGGSRGDLDHDTYVPAPELAAAVRARDGKGVGRHYEEGGHAIPTGSVGVRRLTPLETERLMGWPDYSTALLDDGREGALVEVSDAVRYRMTGNGVVAHVAWWIAARMVALDRELREGAADGGAVGPVQQDSAEGSRGGAAARRSGSTRGGGASV